jgi:hypothetical protein
LATSAALAEHQRLDRSSLLAAVGLVVLEPPLEAAEGLAARLALRRLLRFTTRLRWLALLAGKAGLRVALAELLFLEETAEGLRTRVTHTGLPLQPLTLVPLRP